MDPRVSPPLIPPPAVPALIAAHDLAHVVRRARHARGWSVEDVARAAGVDGDLVARAEGEGFGRMVRVRKRLLERLVGCTLEGLFYRGRPLGGR